MTILAQSSTVKWSIFLNGKPSTEMTFNSGRNQMTGFHFPNNEMGNTLLTTNTQKT